MNCATIFVNDTSTVWRGKCHSTWSWKMVRKKIWKTNRQTKGTRAHLTHRHLRRYVCRLCYLFIILHFFILPLIFLVTGSWPRWVIILSPVIIDSKDYTWMHRLHGVEWLFFYLRYQSIKLPSLLFELWLLSTGVSFEEKNIFTNYVSPDATLIEAKMFLRVHNVVSN